MRSRGTTCEALLVSLPRSGEKPAAEPVARTLDRLSRRSASNAASSDRGAGPDTATGFGSVMAAGLAELCREASDVSGLCSALEGSGSGGGSV